MRGASLASIVPKVGFERHLLADGSNLIHAWRDLKALLPRDRDAARARLSQALSSVHDTEQIRVTIVYDGRGEELTVERPSGHGTFSHIYTPAGVTADDVIEQLVGKAADASLCCVATDDRAERQTIEALGATGISAAELEAWVERARQRQRAQATSLRRDNDRQWRGKQG